MVAQNAHISDPPICPCSLGVEAPPDRSRCDDREEISEGYEDPPLDKDLPKYLSALLGP